MTTEEKLAQAEALITELRRLAAPDAEDSLMFEEDSSLLYYHFKEMQKILDPTPIQAEVCLLRSELVHEAIAMVEAPDGDGVFAGLGKVTEKVEALRLAEARERAERSR